MNARAASCGGQLVTKMRYASITTVTHTYCKRLFSLDYYFLHDNKLKGITTADVKMDMLVMDMDISPILG